jgi:uncharacterized protein (TIGR03437 family)
VVTTGLLDTAPLVNAASFAPGSDNAISPNELVSLFLPGISCPATPAVTLNGVTAQVLAFANGQINVVLPGTVGYGPLTVSCAGVPDWSFNGLQVVEAVPALFTTNFGGTGPGAIVNQDGTVNSAANPASRGSWISVYGTGFGAYNAASVDGLQRLSVAVSATIGGLPATVTYAGQSPGSTLGLNQINLQVPAGVAPASAVPIVLTVSASVSQPSTQAGVTLAVQ